MSTENENDEVGFLKVLVEDAAVADNPSNEANRAEHTPQSVPAASVPASGSASGRAEGSDPLSVTKPDVPTTQKDSLESAYAVAAGVAAATENWKRQVDSQRVAAAVLQKDPQATPLEAAAAATPLEAAAELQKAAAAAAAELQAAAAEAPEAAEAEAPEGAQEVLEGAQEAAVPVPNTGATADPQAAAAEAAAAAAEAEAEPQAEAATPQAEAPQEAAAAEAPEEKKLTSTATGSALEEASTLLQSTKLGDKQKGKSIISKAVGDPSTMNAPALIESYYNSDETLKFHILDAMAKNDMQNKVQSSQEIALTPLHVVIMRVRALSSNKVPVEEEDGTPQMDGSDMATDYLKHVANLMQLHQLGAPPMTAFFGETALNQTHQTQILGLLWVVDRTDPLRLVVERVTSMYRSRNVGDMTEVNRGSEGTSLALAYIDYARTQSVPLQKMSKESRDAWSTAFGSGPDALSSVLQDALLEMWDMLVSWLLEAWVANTDTTKEVQLRGQLMEMSSFADMTIAPASSTSETDPRSLQRRAKVVALNKRVIQWQETDKREGFEKRSKLFAQTTVWATIGEDLNDVEVGECSKSYENMAMCREAKLTRLRLYRDKVEHMLSYTEVGASDGSDRIRRVKLHERPSHLFCARTYKLLRPEIDRFMMLVGERKGPAVKLLCKRFENRALVELYNRMVEMTEDANRLAGILEGTVKIAAMGDKGGGQRQATESTLRTLENLEWACRRTWQQEFTHDDRKDRELWLGETGGATNMGWDLIIPPDEEGARERETQNYNEVVRVDLDAVQGMVLTQSGGADAEIETSLPDDPDDRQPASDAYRGVLRSRVIVRRAYADVRLALAQAASSTVPHGNTMELFVRTCVLPRVQAVNSTLQSVMKSYMTSRWEPDEAAAVGNEEKRSTREASSRSRVSAGTMLGYRIAEPATQVMYALKILRFFGQLAALWAARHVYSEAYTRHVHGTASLAGESIGSPPPPPPALSKMLFVFLGVDATLQLMTLLALVVVSHFGGDRDADAMRRGRASKLLVVDDEFLQAFLADYFLTTAAIAAFGALVAQLMRRKAYFDLVNSGKRAADGYGTVMAGACAVFGAVPFFMLM